MRKSGFTWTQYHMRVPYTALRNQSSYMYFLLGLLFFIVNVSIVIDMNAKTSEFVHVHVHIC